jgi:hypothetical protein
MHGCGLNAGRYVLLIIIKMITSLNYFSIFVLNLALFASLSNIANGEYWINQKDTAYYIELKRFFDGQGIIFSKDDYLVKNDINDKQITLTISDVIEAEIILDSLTSLQFKDDSLKVNEIKAKRRKYNRQYWGIQKESGEKIIQMFIFNFNNKESIKYFESWDKGYFWSTDDFYTKNSRIYRINLIERKLENGWDQLELK